MKMVTVLVLLIFSNRSSAGPTKVGNGDDGIDLEGFDLISSGKLIDTKIQAAHLLKTLNTGGIIGLGSLLNELENSKTYLTKKDLSSKKLEELGAFHSGMEGLVYARTFPRAYAATRFFPISLKLGDDQLKALHIHEALHRSLPESVREDEKIVTKITLAIISPEQTSDGVLAEVKDAIPDLFVLKNTSEIKIHRDSKLQNPSNLKISGNKFLNSKRSNQAGIVNSLDRYYGIEAQFYPFGEKTNATGFGISTAYLFTKRKENYFGPLELTIRNILWTDRGYDFEFKSGFQLMSASNSKIKDSIFGHDSFILGATANKIEDRYHIKFGLDFSTGKKYDRTLNSSIINYDVGSLIDLYGDIFIPWQEFEFGIGADLLSLSSLKINNQSTEILNKDRDQYFKAGPTIKYKLDKNLTITLEGEYLFNSNTNSSEDNIRDLFGNALGQWKWGLSASMLFY